MQVTHLGHACLLLEMAGTRVLVDPGEFTADFAPATDVAAIIVTHQHIDHLDKARFPDLVRRNPDAVIIADPQSAALLNDLGFDAIAQDGAPHLVGGVTLVPIGSIHALIHEDIPRVANVGVRLSAPGEPTFYHPGDTLAEDPGDVDVTAFPLNAPWQRSADMVAFLRRVGAREAIPIHDGLLNVTGRKLYLSQARALGNTTIRDLAGVGATAIEKD